MTLRVFSFRSPYDLCAAPRINIEDALLSTSLIMRFSTPTFLLGTVLALSTFCSAGNPSSHDRVSFAEAAKHIGSNQCIRGKVLRVENGGKGATFLNFCQAKAEDKNKTCPFTVVMFPGDLKKMGNVHQLEGRQIEIKGTIQDYDGRAQIVLRRSQQLGDAAFLLFPTVPTAYDVERAGHKASGSTHAKATKKTTTKQDDDPLSIEEPGEPQ
jgi:hypothetical protein